MAVGPSARAGDAGSLVRQGNRLYEQGKYAEASDKYAEAAKLAPTSPVPLFNQAAARYQSGDFGGAAKLYEQARMHAPDDMRQQINYALGNCHLQQAIQAQDQPAKASHEAKTATQFYRDAIAPTGQHNANSTSDSALYNMELAKRLIQVMQQKQQQQPQERNENDQQKDEKEQYETQQAQSQSEQQQREQTQSSQKPEDDSKDQSTDSGQEGDSKDQPPQPASGQTTDKLSPDDASERLRAAIARAHMARARRLNEQDKQSKRKGAERDW
jgi:Ca-activated chloride channel family protein